MRNTWFFMACTCAAVCSFAVRPAWAQAAAADNTQDQSAQVPRPAPPPLPRQQSPAGRLWSLSTAVSNVYESNIDRNPDNHQTAGAVIGLGAQYQNRANRPWLTAQYQLGGHMYAGAPRWDRVSHNARATYEGRLFKPLTFEAVGEVSIKGSTEDRELGNQYIVSPRLQYRLPRGFRVGLDTGYRLKHYADRTRNATNPYGGVRLGQRSGRSRWDLGYRYEENHADLTRNSYIRSTYSGDVVLPFTANDTLGLELKYRSRQYDRLVRIGSSRVPLRDEKWTISPEWVHAVGPQLQLRASYEFETRSANDPGRNYGAHSAVLAVERRW